MINPDRPFEWKRLGLVTLITTIAGPPLGVWAIMAVLYLRALVSQDPSVMMGFYPWEMMVAAANLALFSYIFGGVPAFLTGLLLGARAGQHLPVSRTRAVLTAAAVTLAFSALLLLRDPKELADVLSAAFLVPSAAVAALAGRWILVKVGLVLPS